MTLIKNLIRRKENLQNNIYEIKQEVSCLETKLENSRDEMANKSLIVLIELNLKTIKDLTAQLEEILDQIDTANNVVETIPYNEITEDLRYLAISKSSGSSGYDSSKKINQQMIHNDISNSTPVSEKNNSFQQSSVEEQSVISSIKTNDSISKIKHFSKLTSSHKKTIAIAYGFSLLCFDKNIDWLDLPKNIMSNYKYSEFDWPSSKVGIKNNNSKLKEKHVVNESADTAAALNHLKNEINLFLEMHNGSSLDSIFTKITDVSSSNSYNLQLIGFDLVGRTDLIISPIFYEEELQMNYCNIQLKSVVKSKIEGSKSKINTTSKPDKLTAQSMAELLASIRFSECPTMQFTTDLDQNFHIMFLAEKNNQLQLRHYNLSGTEAIATISMWLLYFCPHQHYRDTLKPKTNDLNLLANIQRAYQIIKEKIKSAPLIIEQNSDLSSVVEENYNPLCSGTEEDNKSKCQKWVDSLIC